ncbi:LysR family substrate-binding domain-containing protein, partial [Thalassospira sp. UBA1131]|uniref:LysR family substrate-binding domain-containing protein n=1 Tax=Thalassospira sp. UBA1131 TaxID=1947672 RepID=UPI0025EF9764
KKVKSGTGAARFFGGRESRKLTIGCVSPAVFSCLPGILRLFRLKCPDTRIDIKILTTDELLDAMNEGQIDVAFVRPPRSKANMHIEHLFSEAFVGLVPNDHVLASNDQLSLRDFSGLPYIAYSPVLGISYQDVVMQHARDVDVSINIVEEVGHTLGIVALVAAGIGIAVAPSWVTHMPHPDVSYIPMPELPGDAVTLAIAWPLDSKSPVIADFVTCARDFAAEV